jgi:ferritin
MPDMLSKSVQNAINEQINLEFVSAYTYLAMSAYCESINFTGSAQWLRVQFEEEKIHAIKLCDFLLARNGRVQLKAIPAPPSDYKSIVGVFETTLKHEEKVTASINKLYEAAIEGKEFATAVQLQWFLTEQIEEEKTARDILAKLRMIKDDPASLLDLDRELGTRTLGAAAPAAE